MLIQTRPARHSSSKVRSSRHTRRVFIIYVTHTTTETTITDDEEDELGLEFEAIPLNEFEEISDESGDDEDLESAIRNNTEKSFLAGMHIHLVCVCLTLGYPVADPAFLLEREEQGGPDETAAELIQKPEVIDDFFRNFLARNGLDKSLDTFQNEWYEMQRKGKLALDSTTVPDVYIRNQEMAKALGKVRIDVENYKDIAAKARSTYDKLRKERDFHRMHHKRVVQEKNKLISDIKRLKAHYESYEPTLKQMQTKYETAMKEKMLIKLERDKLANRVAVLERTGAPKNTKSVQKKTGGRPHIIPASNQIDHSRDSILPYTRTISNVYYPIHTHSTHAHINSSQDRPNPHTGQDLPRARMSDKQIRQVGMIKAHTSACPAVKFHPKKPLLASVGDDAVWHLWSFPNGERVPTSAPGSARHRDWISDLDFNPRGTVLATSSGDHTVKVWDVTRGALVSTHAEHTGAVWSVAFHDTGDFFCSGSQDHTAKLYDLGASRCRQTFRGHADAVLSCTWMPYTNTVATGSGDKTVSLWDARTGLCASTLYGHTNAVNHVSFSLTGERFVSCDADGGMWLPD